VVHRHRLVGSVRRGLPKRPVTDRHVMRPIVVLPHPTHHTVRDHTALVGLEHDAAHRFLPLMIAALMPPTRSKCGFFFFATGLAFRAAAAITAPGFRAPPFAALAAAALNPMCVTISASVVDS